MPSLCKNKTGSRNDVNRRTAGAIDAEVDATHTSILGDKPLSRWRWQLKIVAKDRCLMMLLDESIGVSKNNSCFFDMNRKAKVILTLRLLGSNV